MQIIYGFVVICVDQELEQLFRLHFIHKSANILQLMYVVW